MKKRALAILLIILSCITGFALAETAQEKINTENVQQKFITALDRHDDYSMAADQICFHSKCLVERLHQQGINSMNSNELDRLVQFQVEIEIEQANQTPALAQLHQSNINISVTNPTEPISLQDSLALVALYNSTNGDNWNCKINWLTSESVENWFGVKVSKGHVSHLYLYQNNLSGTLPAEIGNLSEIEIISMWENKISGVLPEEFGNLSNLGHLNLTFNNLTAPIPTSINKLQNLYFLGLGDNNFSGTIPANLSNLLNLLQLDLHNNNFTGTIPKELGALKNLGSLVLDYNHLNGPLPEELSDLSNLTYLGLANNDFTGTVPAWIGKLYSLKKLNLTKNQFSGIIPSQLLKLTKLGTLELASNQFTGKVPSWLTAFNQLLDLDISNNQFTDMPDLSALTTLWTFDCADNQLTFEDIEPNRTLANTNFFTPQDSVDIQGPLLANENSIITLSVNVGGSANHYQWYKNDQPVQNGTKTKLIVGPITDAECGVYYCKISNTLVPSLTLTSRKYTLEKNSHGTINVVVWHDANENGLVDDDEYGLSGIQVSIPFDDKVSKHLTSSSGKTKFSVPSGAYTVELNADDLPQGAVCTTDGLSLHIDLDENTSITTAYFGFSGNNVAAQADELVNRPIEENTNLDNDALVVVDGSETFAGSKNSRGWNNAVDGQETGWDGTTLAMPDADSDDSAPWAIFKFADEKIYKFNYVKFRSDNGTDDDHAEKICQVKKIQVLVSTTGIETGDFTSIGTFSDKYSTHKMQWCKLAEYVNARYIKLRLLDPIVQNYWTEIVEFGVDTSDKTGPLPATEEQDVKMLPANMALLNNYPNPFNPSTTIVYQVEKEAQISVRIYDIVGKQIAELANSKQTAGQYEISWHAGDLPSGVYFIMMKAGSTKLCKRILLMK